MKCLILEESSEFGGVNKVIRTLLDGLTKHGIVLDLCFLYKGAMSDPKIELQSHFINDTPPATSKIIRSLRFFTTDLLKTSKYLFDTKPDVVVSFGSRSFFHIIILKCIFNYKIVVSERADPKTSRSFTNKFLRFFYRKADTIVFQTKAAQSCFPPIIQNKSVVIPNPVQIPMEQWTKKKWNNRIVSVGRLENIQKRYDVLLSSFAIVHKKNEKWMLELWGDGPDRDMLHSLSLVLGIDKHVIFCGYTTNVKEKLLNGSIFVLSSDYEGQPNSLLEAMAVGVPSISTDYSPGGIKDIIGENEGLIVNRGDAESLAEAIDLFISNPKYAAECGHNARKKMQLFTMNLVSEKWIEAINGCLS